MALYGVQKQEGLDSPQWVITIADEHAPGKSMLFTQAGAFASEAEALAKADELNRQQVRR